MSLKPNVIYILSLFDGAQIYIGCHSLRPDRDQYLSDIIQKSGCPLRVAKDKHLITLQEYKDIVKLIYIEEYETKEEAQSREIELILRAKEIYGERCINKAFGNRYKNLGTKRSYQIRKKQALAYGINGVLQFDKNGNQVGEYYSIKEASRQTGINTGNISAVCHGLKNTAGNYFWRFADV